MHRILPLVLLVVASESFGITLVNELSTPTSYSRFSAGSANWGSISIQVKPDPDYSFPGQWKIYNVLSSGNPQQTLQGYGAIGAFTVQPIYASHSVGFIVTRIVHVLTFVGGSWGGSSGTDNTIVQLATSKQFVTSASGPDTPTATAAYWTEGGQGGIYRVGFFSDSGGHTPNLTGTDLSAGTTVVLDFAKPLTEYIYWMGCTGNISDIQYVDSGATLTLTGQVRQAVPSASDSSAGGPEIGCMAISSAIGDPLQDKRALSTGADAFIILSTNLYWKDLGVASDTVMNQVTGIAAGANGLNGNAATFDATIPRALLLAYGLTSSLDVLGSCGGSDPPGMRFGYTGTTTLNTQTAYTYRLVNAIWSAKDVRFGQPTDSAGDTIWVITEPLMGSDPLTKIGSGQLIISGGQNGYTGDITIKSGTLTFEENTDFSGSTLINNGDAECGGIDVCKFKGL